MNQPTSIPSKKLVYRPKKFSSTSKGAHLAESQKKLNNSSQKNIFIPQIPNHHQCHVMFHKQYNEIL